MIARSLSARISERLGQSVVVEDRTGAGSRDHPSRALQVDDGAAAAVARAPPGDRAGDRTFGDRSSDEPVLVGR